jgi:hypothetical protein
MTGLSSFFRSFVTLLAPGTASLIVGALYYSALGLVLVGGIDLPGRAVLAAFILPLAAHLVSVTLRLTEGRGKAVPAPAV